ncbi:DUF1559 family PulG-like putative transporter [Mariniblastus fucicola]|uniref:DUF1559 domain-containing protein n=1 Tax=Mariniblastus fucicola TaxID=980251 RepID=A0A5B9P9S7_9BACT|nr:DUF1559 domain-containing protein [Mariniblastus fucicola]QEG23054.1 hypothetical protein MFFC18_29460 [Mariniblastus fucicola]
MAQASRKRNSAQSSGLSYQRCEPRTMLTITVGVGNLNSGVAVSDDATGEGFIMYSQTDVHDRFSGIAADNADHFVATRLDGLQWQYNNNTNWIDFEPQDADAIVARVNFSGDSVQNRNFRQSNLEGIWYRNEFEPSDGQAIDFRVVANQFGGQFDKDEFTVLGSTISIQEVAPPNLSELQLSEIVQAVVAHENANQRLPGLANFDSDGNPLLSWRVHMLPHMGLENLYDQFNLDEPWNSANNLPLADQMPDVFKSPQFESTNRTPFLAVAGDKAVFKLDGTPPEYRNANTNPAAMLVEVDQSHASIWTAPVDWYFNETAPTSGIGNAGENGFAIALSTGKTTTVPSEVDPDAFSVLVDDTDGLPNDYDTLGIEVTSQERIDNISLGFIYYESAYQRFPHQAIMADDGTPLLSWRVAILPFIGQQELYNQFNLDEAWDSPNNLPLVSQIPHDYQNANVDDGKTVLLGLDGAGTVFDSTLPRGVTYSQIGDGTSNTILIVEADASEAVEWSRPVDLNFETADPLRGIGTLNGDGRFNALLANSIQVSLATDQPDSIPAWATFRGSELNDYDVLPGGTTSDGASQVESKLQYILQAFETYAFGYREYPHTIYDRATGSSPLLSWRVRILPYIDQGALYQQFRFDEAWDSAHNLSLLPLMPPLFQTPGVPDGMTVFQGAHGEYTVFPTTDDPVSEFEFQDNHNVAAVLQVNPDNAIEWTRPDDFAFDPATIRSLVDSADATGFHIGLLNSGVQFFNDTIDTAVLNKIVAPAEFVDVDVDLKVFRDLNVGNRYSYNSTASDLLFLSYGANNYESAYAQFPNHAIYERPDGDVPLLSWRVEILPFIGYEELYNKFHHDEPWDSDHNLSLLPLMPHHFSHPSIENGMTIYQALTHEWNPGDPLETLFPLTNLIDIDFGDIRDGASNTILFVETNADQAVEWTRPADIVYDPANPTAGLAVGENRQGTWITTADANYRFVPSNFLAEQWAAAVSPSADDYPDFDSDDSYQYGTIVPGSFFGTENDDSIVITATADTLELTINDTTQTFTIGKLPQLTFDGLEGFDSVTLGAADGELVEFVDGVLMVGQFSIVLTNIESIDVADEGRILVRGTDEDDSFVYTSNEDADSISINGSEFDLPSTETPLPLFLDTGEGEDDLTFVLSDLEQIPRFTLFSLESNAEFDLTWNAVEDLEVTMLDPFSNFWLVSHDTSDTLYIDETSILLVGADTTLHSNRESAYTAFWHVTGESNDVIVTGTDGDDVIGFNYQFGPVVDINGSHYISAYRGNVMVDGGDGDDLISFNLGELYIGDVASAQIGPTSFRADDNPAITWTNIESQSAGNLGEVTLLDSPGDDMVLADDSDITWSGEGFAWSLTNNDSVEVTSTGGFDTVVALANPDGFAVSYYWEGLTSYGNGQQRFLARDFDDIAIRGTEPGVQAFYFGTGSNDYIRVSDPVDHLLVELDTRTPVKFEGGLDLQITAYGATNLLEVISARDASAIQLQQDIVLINGQRIDLVDVNEVRAIGDSTADSLVILDSAEDEQIFTGLNEDETERVTSLAGEDYKLSAMGFANIHVELTDGDHSLTLSGIEGEAETTHVGFGPTVVFDAPDFRLVVESESQSPSTFTFGNGVEDTVNFSGTEFVDEILVSLQHTTGAAQPQLGIWGSSYDTEIFSPQTMYFSARGILNLRVDLFGGLIDNSIYQLEDSLSVIVSESDSDVTLSPGMLQWEDATVAWTNVEDFRARGKGAITVSDRAGSETIEFARAPARIDNDFFRNDAVAIYDDTLSTFISFPTVTVISQGNDVANLSGDAESLDFGMNQTSISSVGELSFDDDISLTVIGFDSVNLTTEHAEDFAAFSFDVEQVDVRVFDQRLQFTSPNSDATINLQSFERVNVTGGSDDRLTFLTDTTANGTTTVSREQVLFSEPGAIADAEFLFPISGVGQIELIAGSNVAPLIIDGSAEDETLTIRDTEIELTGASWSVLAINYADISVSGGDGIDSVIVETEMDTLNLGDELVLDNESMTVRLSGFENVDFSDAPTIPQIVGSNLDDRFIVDYSGSQTLVSRVGFLSTMTFSPDANLRFDGKAGNDSITFISPEDYDVSTGHGRFATASSSSVYSNIENSNFVGQNDGSTLTIDAIDDWGSTYSINDDDVRWYDTDAEEEATATGFGSFTVIHSGTFAGAVFLDERTVGSGDITASYSEVRFPGQSIFGLVDVRHINLFAGSQNGLLTLEDSADDDTLTISDQNLQLSSPSVSIVATGFGNASATATSGNDVVLVESNGGSIVAQGSNFDIVYADRTIEVIAFETIDLTDLNNLPLISGTTGDDQFSVDYTGDSAIVTNGDSSDSPMTNIVASLNSALTIEGNSGVLDSIQIFAAEDQAVSLAASSIISGPSSLSYSDFEDVEIIGHDDSSQIDVAANQDFADEIYVGDDNVQWTPVAQTYTVTGFSQFSISNTDSEPRLVLRDERTSGYVDVSYGEAKFSSNATFNFPTLNRVELFGNSQTAINLMDSDQDDSLFIGLESIELSNGTHSILADGFSGFFATATEGSDVASIEEASVVEVGDGYFLIDGTRLENFDSIEIGMTTTPVGIRGTNGDDTFRFDFNEQAIGLMVNNMETQIEFELLTNISVIGLSGDDHIGFIAPATEAVTISDRSFDASNGSVFWNSIESAIVRGHNDEGAVQIDGNSGDDTLTFSAGFTTLTTESGIRISAAKFTDIDVEAGDGQDEAFLSGSTGGANAFIGSSTFGRITTPDRVLDARGFELVAVLAKHETDRASFVGTAADEQFYASPDSARMVGDDFILNATGFQTVISRSNGGDDFANITDSDGDDFFFARPGFARLETGSGKSITTLDYPTVRSVSTTGADEAQLEGSEVEERFLASDRFGRLNGEAFSLIAVSYPKVRANGGGGFDQAFLSDSSGDDFFFGSPQQSFLVGDGFQNTAIDFDRVIALASTGRDSAEFNGSEGDDQFYGNPNVVDLKGEGYFQFGSGFDFVRAYGNGGEDTATLRDSDEVDRFFASADVAYLRNDSYHNELRGFSAVKAVSMAGADIATFEGSSAEELFHGHRDSSYLQGAGFRYQSNGFAAVSANGLAGSDIANLYDSEEDENFGGRGNSAWLEGETYRLQVTDFETVGAYGFQGGANQFFVDDPDFEWNRFGTWNG